MAGIVKMEQRNQGDITTKKATMAYGGGPNDSLSALMNKRAPIKNTGLNNNPGGQISFNVI